MGVVDCPHVVGSDRCATGTTAPATLTEVAQSAMIFGQPRELPPAWWPPALLAKDRVHSASLTGLIARLIVANAPNNHYGARCDGSRPGAKEHRSSRACAPGSMWL